MTFKLGKVTITNKFLIWFLNFLILKIWQIRGLNLNCKTILHYKEDLNLRNLIVYLLTDLKFLIW